jgi:general secretion pathway protein J
VRAHLSHWDESEDGFTLLEALIATAMMAMVLASLASVTAQWMPNWNRGLARLQRSDQLALGLERIVADLAAAEFIPPSGKAQFPLFAGAERSVVLVRTALSPNSSPGLEIIRLAETAGDQGPLLIRGRTPFTPIAAGRLKDNPLNFTDSVVLLRPPYRLLLSYAGADRIWLDSWRDQSSLPKSVRVRVQHADAQQMLALATATVIRSSLPVECVKSTSAAGCRGSGQQRPQSNVEANKSRM